VSAFTVITDIHVDILIDAAPGGHNTRRWTREGDPGARLIELGCPGGVDLGPLDIDPPGGSRDELRDLAHIFENDTGRIDLRGNGSGYCPPSTSAHYTIGPTALEHLLPCNRFNTRLFVVRYTVMGFDVPTADDPERDTVVAALMLEPLGSAWPVTGIWPPSRARHP